MENPEPMKILISLDNFLGTLYQLADIISDEPMMVSWDYDVFARNNDILLYLYKQDVLKLMSET